MSPIQLLGPAVKLALHVGKRNRAPKYIGLKIVAAILLGIAVIFALIALHDYLLIHFSVFYTNVFFAGGFALISLVILLGVRIAQKRYTAPSLTEQVQEQVGETRSQLIDVQRGIVHSLRHHEKSWMLGAAVLGLIFGAGMRGKRKKPPTKS